MKSLGHLTPIYIFDRINQFFYEKTHRQEPWLTKTANTILSSYLKSDDVGLEFGCGRSTIWFGKRVSHLTSVENNKKWYDNVSDQMNREGIVDRVSLYLKETNSGEDDKNACNSEYLSVIKQFEKNQLDFVLVDGMYRAACANSVIENIRPGGLLIIDNVNWYLPSCSRSPASRTYLQGPISKQWTKFLESVSLWRCIWTSNGVTDTALYLKPCC